MADHLSNITAEMIHAECAYQRLIRNFSNSPIVYRETTSFYNKTLGNHIKAMECHKLSKGKAKKEGMQSESNSTATDDVTNNNAQVDKAFSQRVEPAISAQEVFENMPSGPRKMLTTVYVFGFILSIICPIAVIAIGLIDMHSFTKTFEPVRVFSDTLYAVTRIPQLIRRYQLYLNGQITPWTAEIGPVRGTNLEFIPPTNCTFSLRNYVMELRNLSVSILDVAKGNKDIERLSSSKIFNKKQSNSTVKSSSYDMLTSFTNAAEKLLNKTDDQWKVVNTSDEVIFIFDNVDEIVNALKQIMSVTNQNVINRKNEFKLKSIILYVLTWALPFIIMLPLLFITIKNLRAEIAFILKLFIGFPKNEISALRWSMKSSSSTKKANKNATQAQQQTKVAFQTSIAGSASTSSLGSESSSVSFENREPAAEQVVDSLAASSRSHTGNYTRFVRFLLLFMLVSSVLTTIGIALYRSAMLSILNVAHGYVNAVDSTSTAVASYVWGQESFSKAPINNLSLSEVKNKTWHYVSEITETFDNFLYSSESGMKASLLLGTDVINAYVTSTAVNNVSDKYKPQHGFLHSVYFSLSCDTQLRLLWETSLFIMNASDPTEYSFDDNFTYQYEHLIFSHLDYCLKGGQNLLLDETDQIESNQKYKMFLLFFSLFALQILVYFTIILVQFLRARAIHHTVHSLLLLIPPEALLKNQMVLKWISGSVDYTTYNRLRDTYKSKESSNIAHDFIVNNSKSGLILLDGDLKITQVNTTVCSMLKMETSQLQGQNFINILNQQLMDKEKAIVVHQLEHDINKMKAGRARSNSTSIQSSILGTNNQMMYLTITVVGHSVDEGAQDEDHESIVPATSFSVVVVDSTAEHFQAALVASEKAKGEKLIESLLPPSIIKRMNEGETDITFEVQQATVLFTSIVGWSNLTQDMKATQVMTILNSLFVAYDEELHNFPAITKMKTIGHIYMCCGGLFSDSSVNSGQVVVEYATKLLEIAQKVSKDLGISFQITCGVNTGGPIKCGILGVTRPVFDIIGDVVNVASRMNLHCLPGYVQISPSTYDAIKYLNFNVKERGEIQVKGKGMMKTYVVSASSNSQNSTGST
ncbi:Adenylate and Guanylate cyclase catalytic domain containing protein [Trichomonas vaginalis G3]|uniref:Adenylate and Guanylate cyclase catalytic domain containing protein n=1 Tax=Trichomonas vaginalis (strain ATCC PRA-98 / G3) TaxID=412133 RepID=A2EN10_TRIV3|nr:guanylate cyclase protein [Trichomonas vaginalis G3]EAY05995.1 Adenylate and Guanylate cyclase catalytic domain containing protein [Trichomonas vaginalis G3]KAI5512034.1 guanylate cyclase protein [Trichomonas vaginalis G3]|eukprot:XP_001318218.1 Adenylate and Guanylate cyclase catalytic domain containing protein [Trichomonas vaginalis G3]